MTQDAPSKKQGVQVSHVEKNYFFDLKRQLFLGQPGLSDSLEEFQGGYLAKKLRSPNDFHIFQGEEVTPVVYTMISRFKKHLKTI